MTAADIIARAIRPEPTTARGIIEARLGRPLGPLATMPRDLRQAIYLLALEICRSKRKGPR